MPQYIALTACPQTAILISMETKGYLVGTVIDLRHLNKSKAVAVKRPRFQALEETPTLSKIDQMIAELQALRGIVTA